VCEAYYSQQKSAISVPSECTELNTAALRVKPTVALTVAWEWMQSVAEPSRAHVFNVFVATKLCIVIR
jgi:hypothetical protein